MGNKSPCKKFINYKKLKADTETAEPNILMQKYLDSIILPFLTCQSKTYFLLFKLKYCFEF